MRAGGSLKSAWGAEAETTAFFLLLELSQMHTSVDK